MKKQPFVFLSLLTSLASLLASWVTPTLAHAAPQGGDFALGVERLFGFSYFSTSYEGENSEGSSSGTSFSLGTLRDPLAYSAPRVGLDYFTESGLTLGLGLGWASVSREHSGRVGNRELDDLEGPDTTALLLAPRAGFMLGVGDTLTLWPRGGITYLATSVDPPFISDEGSDTALTLEAPLVWFAGSLGLWGGPALDVGLSGSRASDGDELDADVTTWEIGMQFGLFGVL